MSKTLKFIAAASTIFSIAACSGKSSAPDSDAGPDATPMDDAGPLPDGSMPDPDPNAAGFVPSNVPWPTSFGGLGDVVISAAECEIRTDDGTIGCVDASEDGALPFKSEKVAQMDGSEVMVISARSFKIDDAARVVVVGSKPLVLLAQTKIDIRGSLSAGGNGDPTNGGGFGATPSGQGGGPGGGSPGPAGYTAGAGGAYCGAGGKGSPQGGATAPTTGQMYGNDAITPLIGGSSGGGSEGQETGGGRGGGAIQLSAKESFTLGTGASINVGGWGANANGSGGGSGGALLIEAPTMTISGTLAANGGGATIFDGGGPGSSGLASSTPAAGSAQWAGKGSAGTALNGDDGTSEGGDIVNNTGGGGGGAGRIRLNTETGKATLGATAIVSPTVATACATQGMMTKK